MKKYGNICFTRRVVVTLCMFLVAVSVLMPCQMVKADSSSGKSTWWFKTLYFPYGLNKPEASEWREHSNTLTYTGSSPVYSYLIEDKNANSSEQHSFKVGWVSSTKLDSFKQEDNPSYLTEVYKNGVYFYYSTSGVFWPSDKLSASKTDIFLLYDKESTAYEQIAHYVQTGEKSDGMIIGGSGYLPNTQAYSEIGCLDNVQMETYITNKKELDFADENADLAKINQDKVIVYSSTSTTGIDLSKGGYKVQLYGSYAWQDKSGNIKSEDKGHKTFIKDWDAQDNIKGLDRSKYKWIDWKSANDKVEADKTDKAHKPNAFEKMTTYANYQYEPIWYLRIVSQDNKYGAWVKLYNSSTKKGNYDSDSVDDDGNKVSDSQGGYDKTKSTSEITGTGDTPEDAKDNVQKAEEKQDNKDIQDASGGSNSTFDKLEEFTKGIGDVPKMIADIFSFLPSWCLEVVSIGFALLMILIVVKFIRG